MGILTATLTIYDYPPVLVRVGVRLLFSRPLAWQNVCSIPRCGQAAIRANIERLCYSILVCVCELYIIWGYWGGVYRVFVRGM